MPDSSRTTQKKIKRWFVLLISPFVVSLGANIAVATKTTKFLLLFLLVSIVIWSGCYLASFTLAFQTPILRWARARRRKRFSKKPHIAVLDGRISDDGMANVTAMYTTRTSDDWCENLRSRNPSWHIESASVDRALSNEIDIIVNPFGEAYPEEDLSLHTTFTRIRDYVRAGGVYVNVAGYPFWWKSNPDTGVKAEAGRWEQLSPNQMILKPLLPDLLGISPIMHGPEPQCVPTRQEEKDLNRFGEIAGAGGEKNVIMFRQYPITTQRMIPMLRSNGQEQEIVIGAVPYGEGHFLFAAVKIDQSDPGTLSFHKVLASIHGWAKYESNSRK
jgi:hypothetical protein